MPDVVLDVQAVQSRAHGERGIARYTIDLALAVERVAPGLVDAFVMNPALPVSSGLTSLRETGRLMRADDHRLANGAAVYHVASPFESLPLAQLLPSPVVNHRTRVITTVYDLIPLLYPSIYLNDSQQSADYRMRVGLLRSSNRVVCISDATAADVVEHAGVSARRVTPIYGGASDIFVPADESTDPRGALRQVQPTIPARYVLVPSGIEWRKNLDRLFEAYSQLDDTIRSAYPLVVQCHVSDAQLEDLGEPLARLGIAADVTFTGFVADDVLVALYQSAHLVVFPSLYEGLGLPILEARRCGTPVICGDNSSLRELVPWSEARFDALSVPSILARLHQALTDDAYRGELSRCEPPDQFTWDAAGRRFAGVIRQELAAGRRRRPARPRVGIVSPVPPVQCGPSMYINEMLPSMAESAELTLFSANPPEQAHLPVDIAVEPLSMLEHIEQLGDPFDEVIYFFGNSEYHLFYPEFLRRRPGAVVLHDARFHGLYGEIARLRPDLLPGGFHHALHSMYPGRYAADLGIGGALHLRDVHRFGISMIADIARTATSIYAHSEHAAELVELDCAVRPTVLFPLPVRASTHFGEGDPRLVGSFGIVAPTKSPELLIRAVARHDDLRLVFVGPVGPDYHEELRSLAASLGCEGRVEFTNEVSDEDYDGWLRRVGVMAQLRRTSNGESSGAISDAIGSGTPLVLSDMGSFSELPDTIAGKLVLSGSATELGSMLDRLGHDAGARSAMISDQRRYAAENSYEHAGQALINSVLRSAPRSRR